MLCIPAFGQLNPQTQTACGSDALVTIVSVQYKGYDVYVNGIYVGTDGRGGDALDGIYSFCIPGNSQPLIFVNHPLNWKWWQFFHMAGESYTYDF